MPYEAEDIVWRSDAKSVTAVLRFDQVDTTRLVAEAEKIRPPEDVSVPLRAWFPDELVEKSDMTGSDTLNGKSYAADQFFQEPFDGGRVVRVDGTDYFILELTAD
jgi:hypothetical protein